MLNKQKKVDRVDYIPMSDRLNLSKARSLDLLKPMALT